MNNISDVKLKIIKCLIEVETPLILNHIAKKTESSAQLIEYHIKQLLEQKIVNCVIHKDKKCYFLTAPFYDEYKMEVLYKYLTPYVESTVEELKTDENDIVEYETAINTLKYLLCLFIDDISKEV
jgi:DNA-binding transcriptional regulator GbsR (MarR family)